MGKKYKILFVIIAMLTLFSILIYNLNKEISIKIMFDIDISRYEVLNKEVTLTPFKFGGKYQVKLKVEKEEIEYFEKELNEAGFVIDENDKALYPNVVKNITGEEYNEATDVYIKLASVERKVLFVWLPKAKTICKYIIVFECENGDYEVYMEYSE